MKAPGIGSRRKRFINLVGRGKKRKNGRKRDKPSTKKQKRVSRKLRRR